MLNKIGYAAELTAFEKSKIPGFCPRPATSESSGELGIFQMFCKITLIPPSWPWSTD